MLNRYLQPPRYYLHRVRPSLPDRVEKLAMLRNPLLALLVQALHARRRRNRILDPKALQTASPKYLLALVRPSDCFGHGDALISPRRL